jgi:hypothetical protein
LTPEEEGRGRLPRKRDTKPLGRLFRCDVIRDSPALQGTRGEEHVSLDFARRVPGEDRVGDLAPYRFARLGDENFIVGSRSSSGFFVAIRLKVTDA